MTPKYKANRGPRGVAVQRETKRQLADRVAPQLAAVFYSHEKAALRRQHTAQLAAALMRESHATLARMAKRLDKVGG